MNRRNEILYLVLSVLLLVTLACGGSNEGTVITPSGDEQEVAPADSDVESEEVTQEESQQMFEVYEVGDLIEVEDHTIQLVGIAYQGTVLIASFSIENLGSSDLGVSSLLSFSAKKEDGTKLEQEIFGCGTSSLDGSVLPGDRLLGDICWSGANPDDGIKIYYEADLFGSGAVVWNAIEGVADPTYSGLGTTIELETFHVGDLIEIQDQKIRLNSLEYRGTVMVANFSVENHGDSDLNMSSIISFSAKREDGTKLEQEFFGCGTSSLDGSVLPGDRLRGEICWSGANPEDGIRIYYEANLFGEGAVVWEATEGFSEPLDVSDPGLKIDVFGVGDVIQAQDHTIVLNSIEFRGNILQANFTLENQGSSDLDVSSLLLFYARKQDGTELEQEYFDCGTSLDGSVIPGDKLRGDLCWSGASLEDGIKIYYEADLFGEGAIVWIVE